MNNNKMRKKTRMGIAGILPVVALAAGVFSGGCLRDDDVDSFLESGLALLASAPAPIYTGLTDLPTVITQSASNASTISTSLFVHSPSASRGTIYSLNQGLDIGSNTLLQGITTVYNPVKAVLKTNRDIVYGVGGIIRSLRGINPGDQVIQLADTWEGQPAKVRYQADTTHGAGGRKLEIWWDNAAAPYNSLKALELRFRDLNSDTGSDQDINGEVWIRLPNSNGTSLVTIFVDFDYTAASGVRSMAVAIQNGGTNADENAHFYARNQDGITSLDGTFTVPNFADEVSGASASRAYVFTAAGNDTQGRGVIKAAFPLVSSTNISPYGTGQVEAFAEIWTDWFLSNNSIYSVLSSASLPAACQSLTQPSSANPVTASGSTAAQLLACMDVVRTFSANTFDEIYFIPFIQNPAYFSLSNEVVTLQSVGSAPTGDGSYDAVAARTLTTIRTTSDVNYAADFTPNAVNNINISTGANLPTLAQWSTDDSPPF